MTIKVLRVYINMRFYVLKFFFLFLLFARFFWSHNFFTDPQHFNDSAKLWVHIPIRFIAICSLNTFEAITTLIACIHVVFIH